jgi:hypothetical protein
MDSQHIKGMVHALKPLLKDAQKAQIILERYWRERITIIWTVEDVYRAANEIKVAVTKAEATQILQNLYRQHNRQSGLRWSDLTGIITETVPGRELTRSELKRFIHQDILTIRR